MSIEVVMADRYRADNTLVGYLPGGIYAWEETNYNGIGENTPNAYVSGFLVPCMVVKQRSLIPTYEMSSSDDDLGPFTTTRLVIEHYFYNDAGGSRDPIQNAADRIWTLIQDQSIGSYYFRWFNNAGQDLRASELQLAHMIREDYEGQGQRGTP